MILAQATTQPVIQIDLTKWKQAASTAVFFALLGFYHDVDCYLKRTDKTKPWDWSATIARMAAAGLAGASIGFGINLQTVGGWI